MPINTLEAATLFQKNLDLLAVQQMKTGWMDANAGQLVIHATGKFKDIHSPLCSSQLGHRKKPDRMRVRF